MNGRLMSEISCTPGTLSALRMRQHFRRGRMPRPKKRARTTGMMASVFTALALAMVLALAGRPRLAATAMAACVLLSIGEFLWEVYSPDYGFRMPWIQVERIEGARS
jgi:hypothetical protein